MFKAPFSFNGRIRRTEYGISLIIYFVIHTLISVSVDTRVDVQPIILLYIPLLWFIWAQGAKRCHDISRTGWWQIITPYVFWLLLQDGYEWFNQYGDNPKPIIPQQT
jgi:uncharacterized membrane protein YhaH (DUF805 family)